MPPPRRSPPSASAASLPPPTADRPWSIGELVQEVNRWCEEHRIAPASGQAAERLTERNVRFYRTRGLLDAPGGGGGGGEPGRGRAPDGRRGFTAKHVAQLRLIRLFQARGLPLDHIRDQIQDRAVEELLAMERRELGQPELPMSTAVGGEPAEGTTLRAGANGAASPGAPGTAAGGLAPGTASSGQEHWLVSPLGDDFLLVSRRGQTISDEQRRLVIAVLRA